MQSAKSLALALLAGVAMSGAALAQGAPVPAASPGADASLAAPYPIEPRKQDDNISLNGIGGSIDALTQQADQGLGKISAGLTTDPSQETVKLPQMGVSNDLSDVARLRQEQKDIILLQTLNEKAKLANELYEQVFNNENALAYRQARMKAEEAEKAQQAQQRTAPAAAEIPPLVSEVFGDEATLLVPGAGEVTVRPGHTLPNGMRVVSVGLDGVSVRKADGSRTVLGFGSFSPPAPAR